MGLINRILIRLTTRRVGADAAGNSYWEGRRSVRDGRPRRFVLYAGPVEASVVPARWWGWLHHTTAAPLAEDARHSWEKPHLPNLTGSVLAYRPQGSDLRQGVPVSPAGAYEAWTPGR